MPTAISEKIRSRLERLNASMEADRETIRESLLERGVAILEVQRGMEQELREGLREGFEKETLVGILATVRSQDDAA